MQLSTLAFEFFRRLFTRFEDLSQGIHRRRGRYLVVAFPMLWLTLFFLLPLLIVLKISFAVPEIAQPPYTPIVTWPSENVEGENAVTVKLNLDQYQRLKDDDIYREAFWKSTKTALIATVLALLLGYPMAYGIARANPSRRMILLLMVMLPFWTSSLLRTYAWLGLLKDHGLINNTLLMLHIISEPLRILDTDYAVYIGIVYTYLPFMILPLVATLVKLDRTLLEAAADLGCRPISAFLRITLPLSLPGIIAGSMLVFIPSLGEYVIPDILGGKDNLMIGRVLWTEFFSNSDWPMASSIAVAMLLLIVLPLLAFEYVQNTYFNEKKRA